MKLNHRDGKVNVIYTHITHTHVYIYPPLYKIHETSVTSNKIIPCTSVFCSCTVCSSDGLNSMILSYFLVNRLDKVLCKEGSTDFFYIWKEYAF